MSDALVTLTEAVAECPICGDEFDDILKLPRRMPCCEQPICDICLETYISGRIIFPCPLCRKQVQISGGVKSLPKDMTVLRFLDVLKTRRDAVKASADDSTNTEPTRPQAASSGGIDVPVVAMCTACSRHKAIATCTTCGVYHCQACSDDHARNKFTSNHMISIFEHIREARSTRQRGANRERISRVEASDINTKLDKVNLRMKNLSSMEQNINKCQEIVTEQINQFFDDMSEEIRHRRELLLSQVEAKADKERDSIRRALESHKTLQDKVQSFTPCGQTYVSLLQEKPEDVEAERIGFLFTEANTQELLVAIRSAGQVRLVTFTPTPRPSNVPEDEDYNIVTFCPDDFSEVDNAEVKFTSGDKAVIGPHLEFDTNTASNDIKISSNIISNIRPDPAHQDTGCRLQSERRALTCRPLPTKRGHMVVFQTRLAFTVHQEAEEGTRLWETAVTGAPVDANWSQATGLRLGLSACTKHKQQLCLKVEHDNRLLTDIPLGKNRVGVSREVNLCIAIDRYANRMHVIDVTDNKIVTDTEASLDKPLWLVMYVDQPSYTEMTSQLISGRELMLTQQMELLLSFLIWREVY